MGMDAKNEEKNAPELKNWSEKKHDFPPVQIQMMSHEQGSMLRLYLIKCKLLQISGPRWGDMNTIHCPARQLRVAIVWGNKITSSQGGGAQAGQNTKWS